MIPAGRVNLKKFEAIFQEVCMYMPDDLRVSNESFIPAIGHFLQYLDTDSLDVDADPRDEGLMNDYAVGFANYIRNYGVDISRPPPSTGRRQ